MDGWMDSTEKLQRMKTRKEEGSRRKGGHRRKGVNKRNLVKQGTSGG
jgi:hypothetical protein